MDGSKEPQRVPIIKPSPICNGVKPMLVSITRPSWIAAIEEPFPIWQVTILMSSSGWCIKCAQ